MYMLILLPFFTYLKMTEDLSNLAFFIRDFYYVKF